MSDEREVEIVVANWINGNCKDAMRQFMALSRDDQLLFCRKALNTVEFVTKGQVAAAIRITYAAAYQDGYTAGVERGSA